MMKRGNVTADPKLRELEYEYDAIGPHCLVAVTDQLTIVNYRFVPYNLRVHV